MIIKEDTDWGSSNGRTSELKEIAEWDSFHLSLALVATLWP